MALGLHNNFIFTVLAGSMTLLGFDSHVSTTLVSNDTNGIKDTAKSCLSTVSSKLKDEYLCKFAALYENE
jgi:hypothetical protein